MGCAGSAEREYRLNFMHVVFSCPIEARSWLTVGNLPSVYFKHVAYVINRCNDASGRHVVHVFSLCTWSFSKDEAMKQTRLASSYYGLSVRGIPVTCLFLRQYVTWPLPVVVCRSSRWPLLFICAPDVTPCTDELMQSSIAPPMGKLALICLLLQTFAAYLGVVPCLRCTI
jgi:hypothetical protein